MKQYFAFFNGFIVEFNNGLSSKEKKMNKNIGNYLLTAYCATLLVACASTDTLQLTAIEPAPVAMEHSIKRIGILNTSMEANRADYENRLEQLISFDDYRLVKEGKKAAIEALYNELEQDGRFDSVILVEETPPSLLGLDGVPSSDKWDDINKLCVDQRIDAIFCLTDFDANTSFDTKKAKVDEFNMLRVKNRVKGHQITLETLVENGWSIYHPGTRELVDEFVYTDQIIATAKGITPLSALESMENREEKILETSKETGSTYGARLKPMPREVSRPYYITGSEELKAAHGEVEEGNWEAARGLWEKAVSSPKPKVRARACYNIAVLQECRDQLEEALAWAKRGEEAHSTDLIAEYITILEERKLQAATVAIQLTSIAPESP